MPKISIEMFENPPEVGDQVTVMGKVESIDKDTGEVEITYDKVETENAGEESSDTEENTSGDLDTAIDNFKKKSSMKKMGYKE